MRALIPLLASLLPTLAQAEVHVVAPDGADFTQIRHAVQAAADGDTILVRPSPHPYRGFTIDGKALTIVATKKGTGIYESVRIENLDAGRTVVLEGFQISVARGGPGLVVEDCNGGHVCVQSCGVGGSSSYWEHYFVFNAWDGAIVRSSDSVFFVDCGLGGGWGSDWAHGLRVIDSNVALYGSTVGGGRGADGLDQDESGWPGSNGSHPTGAGRLVLVDTRVEGGDGGDGWTDDCVIPVNGGDGGHGLVIGDMPVDELACTFEGGVGGSPDCSGGSWGAQGDPVHDTGNGAPFLQHAGPFRELDLPRVVLAGAATPVTVSGVPGDVVELHTSSTMSWQAAPALQGAWLPTLPAQQVVALGTIPASGVLEADVTFATSGVPPENLFVQALVTDAGANQLLTSPHVAFLDSVTVTSYCVAAPNSTGSGAVIESLGYPSLAFNKWRLATTGAPAGQFGVYFYGASQVQTPLADGFLCVGGTLFRFPTAVQSDTAGEFRYVVDFGDPPAASGAGQITAGSTWNFQQWYRDPAGPGGTGSNLTDGMAVTFRP